MKSKLFANPPPESPGVYIYRDGRGRPIYIGKAKRLADRLASYHQLAQPQKTMAMLAAAKSLDWIVLKSEFEALLCEAAMIRQYKPRYNIDLRDDKRYPLILVTDEPFPKVVKVRRARRGQGRHFGPFPAGTCINLLEILSRRFRIRRCGGPLPKRVRPCIDFDIGRCDAPCVMKIDREEYGALVENAVRFLSGDIRSLVTEFTAEMRHAAGERDFEKAASLRDEIAAMRGILAKQDADRPTRDDADAMAAAIDATIAVVVFVLRRNGAVTDRAQYVFDLPMETASVEIYRRALAAHYADHAVPPVLFVPPDLEGSLTELAPLIVSLSKKMRITGMRVPKRGIERSFLAIAETNAVESLRLAGADRSTAVRNQALAELVEILGLSKTPRAIEGFDNSTFAGKDTVSACVRFEDGLPKKTGYRLYRIRGRQDSDVDAMHEVLSRRAKHVETLPDLILIDGGMGQLHAARNALTSALPEGHVLPAMVSLEKREELVRTLDAEIIRLPRNSAALRLLQQVRDEAHRFGKAYHTKLRSKRAGLSK